MKTIYDYLTDWPTLVLIVVIFLLGKQIVENAAAWGKVLTWPLLLLSPKLYTSAGRRERARRRSIARLLLERLDGLESEVRWDRKTFTELRAAIELVDSPIRIRSLLYGRRTSTSTYRAWSLSKALAYEGSPLIRLEGPAGSGKSVAMRQYARVLLVRASKRRLREHPLAIFVSLRDFAPRADAALAKELQEYIFRQINPSGAPVLADYLTNSFADDLAQGSVVMLLDSFDEIPAVLGSSRVDKVVGRYVDAISGLMGGSSSRCIVASREYKGPQMPSWTRLSLVGLQLDRQLQLLRSYGGTPAQIKVVEPLLLDPRKGFSTDLRNPLYLSLLARYVSNHGSAPSRPSEMFEDYIVTQLKDPELRTEETDIAILICALERLAFELTQSAASGLTATTEFLLAQIVTCRGNVVSSEGSRLLHVAEMSNLLLATQGGRRVAFVHRRVQEYLATRYALRVSDSVHVNSLATDGRWRETAVALLQVGTGTGPLLAEIERLLVLELDRYQTDRAVDFEWSSQTIHLLELLVSAYGGLANGPPKRIQAQVHRLVKLAMMSPYVSDRKFAIDCIPAATSGVQDALVKQGLADSSHWLRTAALRDCAAINPLPDSIDFEIRRYLITLLGRGHLAQEARALDGDLSRIYGRPDLVKARKLLRWTPIAVIGLCLSRIAYDLLFEVGNVSLDAVRIELLWWLLFPVTLFWIFQSSTPMSLPSTSRIRVFFKRTIARYFGWTTDWNTTSLGMVIASIASIHLAISFGTGVWWIATGEPLRGLLAMTIGAASAVFAISWGPAILAAVHRRSFSSGTPWFQVVVPMVRLWPRVRTEFASWGGPLVFGLVKGMLFAGALLAIFYGIFYVLENFAGTVGSYISRGLRFFLVALLPAIIIFVLLRALISRIRLNRRTRKVMTMTPATFLALMSAARDDLDTAESIRLLRIHRSAEVRELPRSFVRGLSALIEGWDKEPTLGLHGELVAALDDGRLDRARLKSWRGDVLDELGQLDEFLRER